MDNYKLISWAEVQSSYSFDTKVNKASIPDKYLTDKQVSVTNISDIHSINSKELDDIDDGEFERLVRKYTIFEDNYLMGGSDFLPYILKGEKVFRDIHIQLLQDSNGD